MRQSVLLVLLVGLGTGVGEAQSIRSLVNGGNDLYNDQKYPDAEVNYRKALQKEKSLVQGHFNLGNALAKQGKNDEAAREYEAAMKAAEGNDAKAYAYYNIGNTQMAGQQYGEAVRSYVNALKINPDDEEAKYNLSYALEKLRQQQQQQQQKQDKQNKNDKNKQDQQKQQQQQQDQNKKNDEKQNQKQNSPQQQQKRMSQADAQRILDVLKNSEKDVQKKLRTRTSERPKTDKDW